MVNIKIYGKLSRDVGLKEVPVSDCETFADVLRHLHHVTDGVFTKALVENKNGRIFYGCVVDGNILSNGQTSIRDAKDIYFAPISSLSDPFSVALVGTYTLGHLLVSIALSVAFALLSMLLAPSPPQLMDGGPETKRKEAYLFDGRARTVNQGSCVPVGYGRMIVPGSVIYNRVNYVEV